MRPQLYKTALNAGRKAASNALNILMPPRCPSTGALVGSPGDLDPGGWANLHFIADPLCPRCGVPFATEYGDDIECPSCIAEPPKFDTARAAVVFDDASAPLVSAFKFSDRTELAPLFGSWMARAGRAIANSDAIIAPVPLHWTRLASRRFNQSAMLAQAVGTEFGAQVSLRAISRLRATPPQRETVSVGARRRNVAGAFAVKPDYAAQVKGAHIILIDDVLTTGATLSACAVALKRAGARRVDALVLARVVKGGVGAI